MTECAHMWTPHRAPRSGEYCYRCGSQRPTEAVSSNEQVAFDAWWEAKQRESFAAAYGKDEPFHPTWGAGYKMTAREGWMARAQHSETSPPRLTDTECDEVISFLEDYEWSGLTRDNVRTWDQAIRDVRKSSDLCPHGMPLAENTCGPCSQGRPNRTAEKLLGDLLAIMHGDGGHYQARHGMEKAVADAISKWDSRVIESAQKSTTEPAP